jgi:hypothetical protein
MAIEAVGRTTLAITTSSGGEVEGWRGGGLVVMLCLATGASSLWRSYSNPWKK